MPDIRLNLSNVEELGFELFTIRKNLGLEAKDIAEVVGRSPKQIARYEAGDQSIPADILIEWVLLLGYDLVIVTKSFDN